MNQQNVQTLKQTALKNLKSGTWSQLHYDKVMDWIEKEDAVRQFLISSLNENIAPIAVNKYVIK